MSHLVTSITPTPPSYGFVETSSPYQTSYQIGAGSNSSEYQMEPGPGSQVKSTYNNYNIVYNASRRRRSQRNVSFEEDQNRRSIFDTIQDEDPSQSHPHPPRTSSSLSNRHYIDYLENNCRRVVENSSGHKQQQPTGGQRNQLWTSRCHSDFVLTAQNDTVRDIMIGNQDDGQEVQPVVVDYENDGSMLYYNVSRNQVGNEGPSQVVTNWNIRVPEQRTRTASGHNTNSSGTDTSKSFLSSVKVSKNIISNPSDQLDLIRGRRSVPGPCILVNASSGGGTLNTTTGHSRHSSSSFFPRRLFITTSSSSSGQEEPSCLSSKSVSCANDTSLHRVALFLVPIIALFLAFVLVLASLYYLFQLGHVSYEKGSTIEDTACEKMFCDFGSVCKIDGQTGKPYCKCENNCKKDMFAPVCGNNNVTYSNECQLRVASCTQQVRLFVKQTGGCQFRDPCSNQTCHFGAVCRSSLNGRSAECVCPEKCETDSEDEYRSSSALICGSDGKDYQGWCELKKAICTLMKNITIKYNGRCDPCEGVVCSPSQVCQLDDQRNPLCKCSSSACSTELRPVCGSNGKTYSNECLLKVEACRLQIQLRVVKQGPCSLDKLQNPCLELNCQESSGEECYIDPFGISTCVCPPICPPILKPVCGTNGLTYESECDLQRTTCLNKTEVKVAYHSACGSEDHRKCESIKCDNGGQCALNPSTGEPQCECLFSCSEEYSPVCGSDGISYNNLCQLKKEACIGKKPILVVYKGLCGGCENKICQHYSVCETDGYGVSECICPETCVSFNDTVCGSDGRTYGSECELRLASCKQKKYIKTISKGSCDLCRNIHCKYGARCEDGFCVCPTVCPDAKEPICATDSRSYANECEMRKYACETSVELSIKFYGDCQDLVPPDEVTKRLPDRKPGESLEDLLPKTCGDVECPFGGTCTDTDVSGPKCSCDFQCESTTNQSTTDLICAEDGIFYESECQLRITSCKQQKQLQKSLTADLCKKSLVTGATNKDCKLSFYGCCPDMKTPSLGPRFAGCPDKCGCNRLGSYAMSCDPLTKQCPCRPGTGGLKCDRCEPGYWGLHLIHDGNSGCTHCACHKYGSVRDDCEQTTGRCVCKDGVLGMKCDHCAENEILTPNGCEFDITAGGKKKTCEDLNCKFGSTCKEDSRSASCTCDFDCEDSNLISVCGSDNNTYGSECQMKLFSCRYQKEILTVRLGPCPTQPTPTLLVVTPVPLPPPPPLALTTTTVIDPSSMSTASDTSSSSNSIHGDPNFQKLSFFGRSWTQPFLKMTRLNAFARLSIELEFQPLSENGILVYNGQMPSGHGDFISLALKSGYIEFKYNLGSGPVLLKSHQKIELGKYIRVSARRYYHDGKLSVAGQEDVLGKSHGSMKNLDLGDYLYVGNVPNDEPKVYNNIGVKQGLFGCISKLKISSKYVDLRSYVVKYSKALKQLDNNETAICFCEPDCDTDKGEFVCGTDGNTYDNECSLRSAACRSPKSILVTNLGPCGDPLSVLPPPQVSSLIMLATAPDFGRSNKRHISPSTLSSSSSSSSSVPTFEALHGSRRSESVHIFSGFSYLELPQLQATNGLILEIEFQSFGNNALLLYNGQRNAQTGHSDFISLTLKSGFVEFRYDLGSGLVIIKSSRKVKSGTHVRVVAKRFLKAGRLSVSGQPDTFDTSPGSMKSLDLTDSLFVGNVPNRNKKLYKNIGVKKGLIGYVHKLKIGPTLIDLKEWPLKYSKSSFSVNLKSKALKRLKQFLKDGTSNVEKF